MPGTTTFATLFVDCRRASKLWRIWCFLGLQDIRIRFRQSRIGVTWIPINLALFVGGAGIIYGSLFGIPVNTFLPFLATGFVVWNLIALSLTESGSAFSCAEGYIRQFPLPKQIYLARSFVSQSLIFIIGLCAISLAQIFTGNFSILRWVYALPGLAILTIAVAGHITFSAYLSTRFRDLPHAFNGILQILFFVTPVIFPASLLKERGLEFAFLYNPLFYLIEIVRHPLVFGGPASFEQYAIAASYAAGACIAGALVAKQLDSRVVFLL